MQTCTNDYINAIYAQSRRIDAQITFTYNGTSTTYDNTWITKISLVEEMSTLNDSIPSDELQVTLDNTQGTFNFLNNNNMYQIVASRPSIVVKLGLEVPVSTNNPNGIEWINIGTYYLDAWKNDFGAITVTLIAHDNFTMLDNMSYGSAGYMANKTLYDIAVDVFNTAGITNYNIDTSLKNYTTTTGFSQTITARQALQHVGIAGMAAVYQDRNGVMQIIPFASIDSGGNYSTYSGTGIYSGFDPYNTNLYSQINDGNGMRRLDLNNMLTVPQITLDKSIYQLIVNIYSSGGSYVGSQYTNSAINGNNGQSFTIDNPLINTTDRAQKVANWYIQESNFNVVYNSNWRGNPILENGDICVISDGVDLTYAKSARLYKQEWDYEGYLRVQSYARGGV